MSKDEKTFFLFKFKKLINISSFSVKNRNAIFTCLTNTGGPEAKGFCGSSFRSRSRPAADFSKLLLLAALVVELLLELLTWWLLPELLLLPFWPPRPPWPSCFLPAAPDVDDEEAEAEDF